MSENEIEATPDEPIYRYTRVGLPHHRQKESPVAMAFGKLVQTVSALPETTKKIGESLKAASGVLWTIANR